MELRYGLPLTVEKVCKVKTVGVKPTNGVNQIHNKSRDAIPNNSNVCNISFPKRFIRLINQRVDRTYIFPSQRGLPSRVRRNGYTTYGVSSLRIVH